ncbi:MAG: hypothetical protein LUD12_02760 [Lachnospiraceae bacterium]|nr:hypothetical protein [Lachnospiraceae bacterium]
MASTKRNKIKSDLQKIMSQKNLTSALYEAQIEQYMAYYDQQQSLNDVIGNTDNQKIKMECMKEMRQIDKSMLGILKWMGIDPTKQPQEKEESYDL